MKATGIIRRVDSLGRIVIPMELRKTMRLKEGEPMEIFTGQEGELIFKKYSPIEEMGALAREYTQAMAHALGCLVCICDQDEILAASGSGQSHYQGKRISKELEQIIESRKMIAPDRWISLLQDEKEQQGQQIICPILSAGDTMGAVIMVKEKQGSLGEAEKKQAQIAADFLALQMEN